MKTIVKLGIVETLNKTKDVIKEVKTPVPKLKSLKMVSDGHRIVNNGFNKLR